MRKPLSTMLFVLGAGSLILVALGLYFQYAALVAAPPPSPTPSAYGTLLESEIRGLDPQQIEEYLNGEGMGLALPAELNGYPGPRHVLDMADALELDEAQEQAIQGLFDEMKPRAVELGRQIVEAEAALEQSFREGTIDEGELQTQLGTIGKLESRLRYVHLRTHLATVEILSPHQVARYNELRGYASAATEHSGSHHQP